MADVRIRTRPNGPFLVEGGFTLVDSEGKEFKLDANKNYALCRCGHSSKKPF
jgi:CDGSH-type Zn-finger protein